MEKLRVTVEVQIEDFTAYAGRVGKKTGKAFLNGLVKDKLAKDIDLALVRITGVSIKSAETIEVHRINEMQK